MLYNTIVDAVDRERFPEAKRELDALLTSEELASVPFLVLGNKIDLGRAASEEDLRYQLGVSVYSSCSLLRHHLNLYYTFLPRFIRNVRQGEQGRRARPRRAAHRVVHVFCSAKNGIR
jgi:GTPase SAR1 family protein